MEIHIVDTDPFSLSRNGGLSDVTLVEKYKISDEAYEKRKGTMREYIREQRKQNPNFKLGVNPKSQPTDEDPKEIPGPESVEGMVVGSRCEVKPGERRGTIRFVGEIPEISAGGYWVSTMAILVFFFFCILNLNHLRLEFNSTNHLDIMMVQ
jgi:tubulin-folding cofactor B